MDNDVVLQAAIITVQSMDVDVAVNRLGYGRYQQRLLLASGICFSAVSSEITLLSS